MLYKLKQDYIRLANADNLCTELKTKSFKSCLLLLNFEIAVNIQGEDNVLVLQTEVILRLVLKIHENDTNII